MNLLNKTIIAITVTVLLTGQSKVSAESKPTVLPVPPKEVLEASGKSIPTLITKYAPDLRSSLRLIVRAYEIGVVEKAAFQYHQALQNDKTNPELMAEYAFAYLLSGENTDIQNASAERRSLKEKLRDYPYYLGVITYRSDSIKRLSSSPEVYIMASAEYELRADYQQAITLSKKAVSLDPNWGYAHLRVGQALVGLSGKALMKTNRQSDADEFSRQALLEFTTAQKLDSSITGRSVFSGYATAYAQLKQYKQALVYLDKMIALTDKNRHSYPALVRWRRRLVTDQASSGSPSAPS